MITRIAIHDLYLIILALAYLAIIILNQNIAFYWIILACGFLNISMFRRVKYKLLFVLTLWLIPLAIAIVITSYFFVKTTFDTSVIRLFSRNVSLTLTTVMISSAIDFEQLLLYLMQRRVLPVKLGYPLLAMMNSLSFLLAEFKRIKDAYLMRFGSKKYSIRMLYPVLVSAARYAFVAGISLESRGLNQHKTYVRPVRSFKLSETIYLITNIMFLTALFVLFNYSDVFCRFNAIYC